MNILNIYSPIKLNKVYHAGATTVNKIFRLPRYAAAYVF